MIKPKNIQEYIISCPTEVQERLWAVHECILQAAPGVTESLKWGMPAYSYDKILVMFSAAKKHIGFYPMNKAIMSFAKELAKYKTGEGSIQFPLSDPLPLALITKIVKSRVKESKAGIMRWRK